MANIEKVVAFMQRRRVSAFTQYALVPQARAVLQRSGGVAATTAYSSSGWIRAGMLTAVLACTLAMLSGCGSVSLDARPAARNRTTTTVHVFFFVSPRSSNGSCRHAGGPWAAVFITTSIFRKMLRCPAIAVIELAKYGVDPGQSVSLGHNKLPGGRNSPTVYNAGLQFVQFWDGRAPTLAAQASGPMMNPVEMGMSGPEAVLAYIHSSPAYVRQFQAGISRASKIRLYWIT